MLHIPNQQNLLPHLHHTELLIPKLSVYVWQQQLLFYFMYLSDPESIAKKMLSTFIERVFEIFSFWRCWHVKLYRVQDYKDMSRKAANIISMRLFMKPNCVLESGYWFYSIQEPMNS